MEPHEPLETLDQVRAFIDCIAADLDPDSRYVRELRGIVAESEDVEDLQTKLFAGCRGLRHSGPIVFAEMLLEDQLRANLITNETDVSRFESHELTKIRSFLRDMYNPSGVVQVLVAPCSTGAEVYTYAMATIEDKVPACINGRDIQYEALRAAASGVLDVGIPARFLDQPARVSKEVLARVQFDLVDLLHDNLENDHGKFDLVSCRNFLGYFTWSVVQGILARLVSLVSREGILVLDSYILEKHGKGLESAVVKELATLGFRRYSHNLPIFVRF